MAQLQFELVSPEKLLVSKAVVMVTVPGGEGDYGVLTEHAPLITTVRPGVIAVYEENDSTVTDRIFVAGGFAEVTGERCTLLVEEAVPVAELDNARIQEEIRVINENMPEASTDHARKELEDRLSIAEAKLQALAA
jgi:F-type H+-transporting ATPase subunit epsilon